MRANQDVVETAKMSNVKLWEIAEELGKSPSWLSVKMRKELTEDLKIKIYAIICQIEEKHSNGLPE